MSLTITAVVVVFSLIIGFAVRRLLPHKIHKPIEQAAEQVIKEETGVDIKIPDDSDSEDEKK